MITLASKWDFTKILGPIDANNNNKYIYAMAKTDEFAFAPYQRALRQHGMERHLAPTY